MAKPVVAFIGESVRAQDMVARYYENECGVQTIRAKDHDLARDFLNAPEDEAARAVYLERMVSESLDYAACDPLVVCDLVKQPEVDAVRRAAPQTRFFKLLDPDNAAADADLDDFLSFSMPTVSCEGFPITVTNRLAVVSILAQIGLHHGVC